MSFTNSTPNYNLPQWIGTDKATWGDMVPAFSKIDTTMKANATTGANAQLAADAAQTTANTANAKANNVETTATLALSTANEADSRSQNNSLNIASNLTFQVFPATFSQNIRGDSVITLIGSEFIYSLRAFTYFDSTQTLTFIPYADNNQRFFVEICRFTRNIFKAQLNAQPVLANMNSLGYGTAYIRGVTDSKIGSIQLQSYWNGTQTVLGIYTSESNNTAFFAARNQILFNATLLITGNVIPPSED